MFDGAESIVRRDGGAAGAIVFDEYSVPLAVHDLALVAAVGVLALVMVFFHGADAGKTN